MTEQPNVLFIMTDQQRFDTIRALGNTHIVTPNLDRLVKRGISFVNAYSTCPVCVPARYTVRTGCEPPTIRIFSNGRLDSAPGQAETMEGRCGPYLARTMKSRGYRTFGIGKFHTQPWDEELGYDVHLHSEELYGTPEQRHHDAYAGWIEREHPEYDFVEALMGERTDMYLMPQMSPMPGEVTVERWAADRAVEQLRSDDVRPYFGFVSFIGPHPPFAPPIPFNRMYDPDHMPNPVATDIEADHLDDQLPYMNYHIWGEDIDLPRARALKARYYGEITYIDDCLGRILDAVEARDDADNTLICFFADHGEHLGDHHAWQKESFFDASAHVPFLASWPKRLPADTRREDLVCLTDLFALATGASGNAEPRDGIDLLAMIEGRQTPREFLVGYYGNPGTRIFKVMVRDAEWKYIFMANGGREQLFNMKVDPHELENRAAERPEIVQGLKDVALSACDRPGCREALDGGGLKTFPFETMGRKRIYQFDVSRGIRRFPEDPADLLEQWKASQTR